MRKKTRRPPPPAVPPESVEIIDTGDWDGSEDAEPEVEIVEDGAEIVEEDEVILGAPTAEREPIDQATHKISRWTRVEREPAGAKAEPPAIPLLLVEVISADGKTMAPGVLEALLKEARDLKLTSRATEFEAVPTGDFFAHPKALRIFSVLRRAAFGSVTVYTSLPTDADWPGVERNCAPWRRFRMVVRPQVPAMMATPLGWKPLTGDAAAEMGVDQSRMSGGDAAFERRYRRLRKEMGDRITAEAVALSGSACSVGAVMVEVDGTLRLCCHSDVITFGSVVREGFEPPWLARERMLGMIRAGEPFPGCCNECPCLESMRDAVLGR